MAPGLELKWAKGVVAKTLWTSYPVSGEIPTSPRRAYSRVVSFFGAISPPISKRNIHIRNINIRIFWDFVKWICDLFYYRLPVSRRFLDFKTRRLGLRRAGRTRR